MIILILISMGENVFYPFEFCEELKGRVINLDRKSASFKYVSSCKNDDKDYSLLEKYDIENKLKLKTLF